MKKSLFYLFIMGIMVMFFNYDVQAQNVVRTSHPSSADPATFNRKAAPLPIPNDPSSGFVRGGSVKPPAPVPTTTPPKQQTQQEKVLRSINERLAYLKTLPNPTDKEKQELVKLNEYLLVIKNNSK